MVGDDDPVTPLEDSQAIAAAIPQPWGELVRFPGVGHGAWRDDPAAAEAALRRFVGAA
jgi:pimeloyl-ACP methyl ester carboxylesterase